MDFLVQYTEQRFRNEIREIVTQAINEALEDALENLEKPEPNEYLTREETARVLKVSLPTLHKLTKEGLIKGYRVGRHIRYKSYEIDAALKEVRTLKYRRT